MDYIEDQWRTPIQRIEVGDSIRMEAKVTSKTETQKERLCEYDWVIRNQDDVMVAEGHNR